MSSKKPGQLATRIHGIWIHPRKPRPGRQKWVTLKFVLTGAIPAKKNNQVAIAVYNKARNSKKRPSLPSMSADAFAQKCFTEKGSMSPADLAVFKELTAAVIVPSGRHRTWHRSAKEMIDAQMKDQLPILQRRGLIYPLNNVSITIYHSWKDKTIRDLGNRWESIGDLFTDAQLISDDNDFVIGPLQLDSGRYGGEIIQHTTVICLTAYYSK